MLPALAAAGAIQLAGGLFGARSAKKAVAENRKAMDQYIYNSAQEATKVQGAYNQYGQGLKDLSATIPGRFNFKPYAMRSGYGTTEMGDNGITTTLAPEYQGLRNGMLAGSQGYLDYANQFNPDSYAGSLYDAYQGTMANQRSAENDSLYQGLLSKGLIGMSSNSPTAGGGNPFFAALSRGRADADAKLAISARENAFGELQKLYGLSGNLASGAAGIDNLSKDNFGMFATAQQLAQPFQLNAAQTGLGLDMAALNAPLQGQMFYSNNLMDLLGKQYGSTVSNNAANQQISQGRNSAVTGALSSLVGGFGGMFGGGGFSVPGLGSGNPFAGASLMNATGAGMFGNSLGGMTNLRLPNALNGGGW
jgi:hypothetical protein